MVPAWPSHLACHPKWFFDNRLSPITTEGIAPSCLPHFKTIFITTDASPYSTFPIQYIYIIFIIAIILNILISYLNVLILQFNIFTQYLLLILY